MVSEQQHPDEPIDLIQFTLDVAEREAAAARAARVEPATSGPTTPISDVSDKRRRAWLDAMHRRALERMSAATEGSRNDTLNKIAYTLGGIVHLGLDEQRARDDLRIAALSTGLDEHGTHNTLQSGFSAGLAKPLSIELAERDMLDGTDAPLDVDEGLVDFWEQRALLTHLRDFARARRVSPWAVLGVSLARVVASMPPALVLPPIIGGVGSLNTFVGLVGPSGAGKGGAERAAADAVTWPYVGMLTVGSGEGITHSYVKRDRSGETTQIADRMLFSVPEVDTLAAVAGRVGATLLPELRRAWSGEALGFAYADPTKRLIVPAHSYRLALILGIQPGKAKPLLDDADGGTPQRFVWLPAVDREAPDVAPPTPDRADWLPPDFVGLLPRSISGSHIMSVCDLAVMTIVDAHLARTRGDADALDGHLLYAQLKVAATLALLDMRLGVDDADWSLASTIMRVSMRTRESVRQALTDARTAKTRASAESYADRTFIVADKAAERAADNEEKAMQRIMTLLDGGVLLPRGDLRRGVRYNHRHAFDDALKSLLDDGTIVAVDDEGVVRYALVRR